MSNVVDILQYKTHKTNEDEPHLVIFDGHFVHVVSVETVKNWINGTEIPDPGCVKRIMAEWLELVTS